MHIYFADSPGALSAELAALFGGLVAEGETEDVAFDVRLIACELASNILKYSPKKRAEFWCEREGDFLLLRVRGDVGRLPCAGLPPAAAEGGRGLHLIHSLPRYSGCERGGKTVTVRVKRI